MGTYGTGNGVALSEHNLKKVKPDYMISHAWGEDVEARAYAESASHSKRSAAHTVVGIFGAQFWMHLFRSDEFCTPYRKESVQLARMTPTAHSE